jgi:transcriptional adapter 2-alpha
MPKRGDFEHEYDMDADLLLADMEFFDDDDESDVKLKYNVIELYNARLDERIRRKKFVIERGILDIKRT